MRSIFPIIPIIMRAVAQNPFLESEVGRVTSALTVSPKASEKTKHVLSLY